MNGPARKAWAPKWLVVTHRYVGLVMGLLMLIWFLSGIGMLFIHWPAVSEADRLRGLAPISWSRCCLFGETPRDQPVGTAMIEDLAGRPVLRFDDTILDLTTGRPLAPVTAHEAAQIAGSYARANAVTLASPSGPDLVRRDQWTVTGYFNSSRPFRVLRGDDRRGTDIYVSVRTGQVAQVTDRPARLLNWLGPIPHWLYPEVLRADTRLWTQVVIWTSIVGIFLTVTGLYLGLVAWRPWRDRRLTPYRGLMAWHHLTGLAAGLLTLTWVASGLLSMNPWGLLESPPDRHGPNLAGVITFGDLTRAVASAKAAGVEARQLRTAPLAGRMYLMADDRRLDDAGARAPLSLQDLAVAARRLGPVKHQGLMAHEDAYYYGHHQPVTLPVYRVERTDGVRFYLDLASGQIVRRVDAAGRASRWLFEGLHRLDIVPGLDRGASWKTAMIVLLILAGGGVATGVWLAWRRLQSDVRAVSSSNRFPRPG